MKKSFILYIDMLDVLDDLNNEDIALLFTAIKSYHNNETPILPYSIKAIFKLFENQFDRDAEAYENKCNKATAAANKRWHKDAGACGRTPSNAQDADTDNDTDTVNEKKREAVVYPDELNVDAWLSYIEYRKISKMRRLLPQSEEKQIKKLVVLSKPHQLECIEQTISNGWTGLFPEKLKAGGNGKTTNKNSSERFMENLRDIGGY